MFRKIAFALILTLLTSVSAFSSCTSPQNAIEAENCQPGTPETIWGRDSGSGDSTIQGFTTDISFNVGQTVNFKVNTPATAYRIDIYRMGYYQGNGARLIASVNPSAKLPQTQPACATDASTKLYDCGTWAVSASWTIPSTAVSGIYIAELVRSDTGGSSQIIFVVRNDSSHSDILFQTSDETWHAYNPYGGHSLYGDTSFNITVRANKVSYNRPFNTASLETWTWIYNAEYPMVRWLEANGYDVSYFSSVDAARNGSSITNHKIYLSVGHDEYWSAGKRSSVEAARAAGVNLAFFSGNEVFWKTRWENSIDGSNTPYRTLVCYKETLDGLQEDPLDPPIWTGTWRDPTLSPPADGGRPENALTGTLFRVNGPGADNNYLSVKVPAADGKMRFWRNTAVGAQTAGQTFTLPAGTLGYEWDVDQDNGFRPAGLFDLSTANYSLTTDYLLDYGGSYGVGSATHHLTMYRYYTNLGQQNQTPLGLVFGAGTVQWSWGLDSDHDNANGTSADPNMKQATVNLFADMGVQPATLAGGLLLGVKSADLTPPASQITSPAPGAIFTVGATVNISGTAKDSGGGVVGGVEVSADGGATWHAASGRESWSYSWIPSASGNITLLTRAADDSANLEVPSSGVTIAIQTSSQKLTAFTLNASSVSGGTPVQGTVTLGQPAASGGVVVSLSSSNAAVASVPASVTVPAGQFSANFTVTTTTVPLVMPVTISATYVATISSPLTVRSILPPNPGNVAVDALISKDQPNATSINSGTFSTTVGNELLLAFVASDSSLSGNMSVASMTGAGLTWSLVLRTNVQFGTAEIWRAFATAPLTNVSLTANLSQSVASSMLVMSFAGVDPSGSNGAGAIGAVGSANAASGAPTGSLNTTRNNSLVLGVGVDWDKAIARVVGANQTMLHQNLSSSGDTYWMQMQTQPIPASGTKVTINDTSPTTDRYNLSLVEVLAASAGSLSISGSVTPASTGSGTTLTLTGNATATTTADASGNYSFPGLVNGSYTVTPSRAALAFNPKSQTVTLNGSSATAVNFTALTLTSISVSPSQPSIPAGSTQQFAAMGTYSDGSSQDITAQVSWASSNLSVATINGSGLASAIAGGASTISATLGTINGGTTLTVNATPLSIATTSLPNGTQNQLYSAGLNATGGTAPYSWSLVNGTVLPAGLALSTGGQITGAPLVAGPDTFTVQVTDGGSPAQTATSQFTINVAAPPSFYAIWAATTLPLVADAGADSPVELGVKFRSDVSGAISGIRFYKSSANTGAHIGNLWSATGTNLASATFTNETASGWQQVNFASPVAITAGTVYVASYHGTVGHYADDENYFATAGVDNVPLHALQDGISGSDGVFAYGPGSTFPATGFNSSNYWVDVVFVPSTTLQTLVITPANPSIVAGSSQPFTATGTYSDGTTQNLTSQVTWTSSNSSVATINASGIASGLAGGTSSIKAALSSVSGSTTLTVQPTTLSIATNALPGGTQNQAYSVSLTATGGTPPYIWSLVNGTALPAGLTLSATGQISGTPTGSGSTTFTVQVTDSAATSQTATASLTLVVAPNACPCTISGAISGQGGSNATVTLNGAASAVVTADGAGNYTFGSLSNGSYTVTPSQSGYSFTPANQIVTVNGANVGGINFSAVALPPVLSISAQTVSFSAVVGGSNPSPATVNVTNTGGGTISFTAASDSTWLSVSPASGTAPQTLQISAAVVGLAAGTYTGHVTVTATGVQGSPATITVTLTVSSASSGITIDATAFKDQGNSATTVTSAAFSTKSPNELLLAFIATDAKSSGVKVNSVTGAGLTWVLVARTNAQLGTSEIWRAFATTTLASVSVQASLSQNVTSSITVMSFSGVDTTGTSGSGAVGNFGSGNGPSGAPTAQLTTTRNNSLVIGVGNDWDKGLSRTVAAGQTMVHQYLSPNGDTYWVQMQNATTPLSGTSVIINDTAPTTDRYNLTTVEVRTP